MAILDLLDIFLEEIEPIMKSPAWYADKEARLYLTERAKERARARWSEQNFPKLNPKP